MRDTEGTVLFTLAKGVTGGSLRTIDFAKKHKKPWVHISARGSGYLDPALILQEFVREHGTRVLNVAGSRESKEPGLHGWVIKVIDDAFFWSESHPGILGTIFKESHRGRPTALENLHGGGIALGGIRD